MNAAQLSLKNNDVIKVYQELEGGNIILFIVFYVVYASLSVKSDWLASSCAKWQIVTEPDFKQQKIGLKKIC